LKKFIAFRAYARKAFVLLNFFLSHVLRALSTVLMTSIWYRWIGHNLNRGGKKGGTLQADLYVEYGVYKRPPLKAAFFTKSPIYKESARIINKNLIKCTPKSLWRLRTTFMAKIKKIESPKKLSDQPRTEILTVF